MAFYDIMFDWILTKYNIMHCISNKGIFRLIETENWTQKS